MNIVHTNLGAFDRMKNETMSPLSAQSLWNNPHMPPVWYPCTWCQKLYPERQLACRMLNRAAVSVEGEASTQGSYRPAFLAHRVSFYPSVILSRKHSLFWSYCIYFQRACINNGTLVIAVTQFCHHSRVIRTRYRSFREPYVNGDTKKMKS